MRIAFSTVACPELPIDETLTKASQWGYDAVEFRTFGASSTQFANDPALSSPAKLRRLMLDAGVEIACLATGIGFDAPIRPMIAGRFIGDQEKAVRQAKWAVDLATQIESPMVRVFGFQIPDGESRKHAIRRIAERLCMVVDHCRNTGVRLVIENGGSFSTASQLHELIDAVDHPLLGVSYCMAVAHTAGENPEAGVNVLGDKLWLARIRDVKDARMCRVGEGELPCQSFIATLEQAGFQGPVIVDWDRAWIEGLEKAEKILPGLPEQIRSWANTGCAGDKSCNASETTAS